MHNVPVDKVKRCRFHYASVPLVTSFWPSSFYSFRFTFSHRLLLLLDIIPRITNCQLGFLQSMIFTGYKHLNVQTYSQTTAVGIWTALLLACNGIAMLLYFKRKFLCQPIKMFNTSFYYSAKKNNHYLFPSLFPNENRYMASLAICVATLLAGILTIGIAAGTFYGLLSNITTESTAPQMALAQLGKTANMWTMIRMATFLFVFLSDELTSLKVLEGTLFGCGLASIFVNTLSIMFLRLKKIMSQVETVSHGLLSNSNRY